MSSLRPFACRLALLAAAAHTAACGGGGDGLGTTPSRPLTQVGGTYATAVSLLADSCGGTRVESQPTVIAHTAGDARFRLTHAAIATNGTLSAGGTFVTEPVTLPEGASSAGIRIAGRFHATGFDAEVTVAVARSDGAACGYSVRWTGTKQGPPNVLP